MEPVVIQRLCSFTPAQLYRVAADIERYPEFLPNCTATRIRERKGDEWLVDNVFRWGPVPLKFQTRAKMTPPRAIDIRSINALGLNFVLGWRFEDAVDGTHVIFEMELDLPGAYLESLAHRALATQAQNIVDAFLKRTAELVERG